MSTSNVNSGYGAGAPAGISFSRETAAPNNSVNASRLLVDVPTTNGDLVLQPKGTGAIIAELPTGTSAGGNKRGLNAIDIQIGRSNADEIASGQNSTCVGGWSNQAAGIYGVSIGGNRNRTQGQYDVAIGGTNIVTVSSASYTGTLASNNLTASAGSGYSYFFGANGHFGNATGLGGNYRLIVGSNLSAIASYNIVFGDNARSTAIHQRVYASGAFTNQGDCQNEGYLLRALTTNANITELLTDGSGSAGVYNRVGMRWGSDGFSGNQSANVAFAYEGLVIARRNGVASETAAWKIQGLIVKDATTVSFVGTPTLTQIGASTGATTWALSVTADTATNCLLVQATGETGKTIRWAAHINLVKVAG